MCGVENGEKEERGVRTAAANHCSRARSSQRAVAAPPTRSARWSAVAERKHNEMRKAKSSRSHLKARRATGSNVVALKDGQSTV